MLITRKCIVSLDPLFEVETAPLWLYISDLQYPVAAYGPAHSHISHFAIVSYLVLAAPDA
jgi:hypothetical protein